MANSDYALDDLIHAEITRLCAVGDRLAERLRYEDALLEFSKAWQLIPEPKNDWETSTWVLAAIADSCFHIGRRESARKALDYAMTCPGGLGNPFLHLRRGQILLDLDESDAAADELMRAYMGGGEELFAHEDPKYLSLLRTKAAL